MSTFAKSFLPSTRSEWSSRASFVAVAILFLFILPAWLSDSRLDLMSSYIAYAIVAIGIAIAWGNGGMLVLGQGLFFGLGAYCVAMYLALVEVGGAPNLPQFMTLLGSQETLPALWKPFNNLWFALSAAVIVPVTLAAIVGTLIFRSRIRGPYFAILTQALAGAFAILLIGNITLINGTNGITTSFSEIFGLSLSEPEDQKVLYTITVVVLGIVFLLARQMLKSRYGKLLVAVRDAEDRVRFLGYSATKIKVIAFSTAAGLAGIGGALFVLVGPKIISPASVGIIPSITMVVWVAVGGRASLAGAIAGAILVNMAEFEISSAAPEYWLYFQGALFIGVVAFAPKGLAGAATWLRDKIASRNSGATSSATPVEEAA